jgi:hypothetical protein
MAQGRCYRIDITGEISQWRYHRGDTRKISKIGIGQAHEVAVSGVKDQKNLKRFSEMHTGTAKECHNIRKDRRIIRVRVYL